MFEATPRIDKHDPLPRHAQVQRLLCDMVRSGKLKPGDKIPAELHIADALGVSKMTVNKAILALTASGLFVREVGRGTFVSENAPSAASQLDSGLRDSHIAGASRSVAHRREAPVPTRPQITLSFPNDSRNILDSDYYSTLYRGVHDIISGEAEGSEPLGDLSLVPLASRDFLAEERRAPADGLIIIAPRVNTIDSIDALWEAGKALVVLGASWSMMNIPSIDSDNVGGAMEAMRHLIGLGHKRIALLYAEAETANIQDRIIGYRRAFSTAHLPNAAEWEVEGEKAWKIGEDANKRLVDLITGPERVTAILAAGHYLALEAMNAVRHAGLSVPKDVSVVGFDDPLSAQLVYPPLTSVRQPLYEMGRRAGERVLRLLSGEESRVPIREVLPAQLIVRQSTTAPTATPSPKPASV